MKKVLLFAPDWVDFISEFEKNLKYCGFEVVTINRDIPPFKYKNAGQKIYNFLRKTFLRDFSYKKRLKEKHIKYHQYKFSSPADFYDYAFIVRADILTIDELKLIRQISVKMVGYHFDALHRYPGIFSRINYFDRFFVFDPEDLQKYPQYRLQFITNFYFDYPGSDIDTPSTGRTEYDLYYLGSYEPSRMNEIVKLSDFLIKNNTRYKIELFFYKDKLHKITPELEKLITCLTKSIPMQEYLLRVKKAAAILDFVLPQHTGLSFRVFESIRYEKKLVTTNQHVMHYDFYIPDNIFILNDNYEELAEFLKRPYVKLPAKIRKKYSFTNWIKNVFEEGSFEKIHLNTTVNAE
ncbi:hypothetical protein A8C56_16130 [Niabella ginsenosidivorans]|uniref:Lipopolysaccharide biosynthesis protein n=1 Tax=Niabella ginsenosidivorans TaxID=1176587 RepID=A0A1A9I6F7_9BACT|nr:hypothetical protein [Niabella ginsenosidivorans]ANH82281.1 hypothetical protein A8C56_16130 [Niabella ginsenosidivorans]